MDRTQKDQERWTIGPLGEKLIRANLPPRGSTRWVPRRKAEVVAAVDGELLTLGEACDRYGITLEEFSSWQLAVECSGMLGPAGHARPALPGCL